MVFEWLRGNQQKKFVRKLVAIANFTRLPAKDITTGNVTKAIADLQALQALLKDLQDSFWRNRATFFAMNKKAAACIETLVHQMPNEVQSAIDLIRAVKRNILSGVKPSGNAAAFAEAASLTSGIRQLLCELEEAANTLNVPAAAETNVRALAATSYLWRVKGMRQLEETADFQSDKKKYAGYQVAELQRKIINSPVYVENWHEVEKRPGPYCGYLKARLTSNLRLIYRIDSKTRTLYFEKILTHDDYDRLFGRRRRS